MTKAVGMAGFLFLIFGENGETVQMPMPSESVSGGVLGLPVRDLAVGSVVGFELAGDELELPVEDVALRVAALCAECVEFAAQAV